MKHGSSIGVLVTRGSQTLLGAGNDENIPLHNGGGAHVGECAPMRFSAGGVAPQSVMVIFHVAPL